MLISYYVDLSKSMPQILLVHRFRNNYTTHLSANPIGIVIYETMYQERGK